MIQSVKIWVILTAAIFLARCPVLAREADTLDFYRQIKGLDLSGILVDTALNGFNDSGPLGFIGNEFQRFLIHFDQIGKSPENPYTYTVSGKTMVKNNRCDFNGYIRIIAAFTFPSMEVPAVRYGELTAVVHIEEGKKHYGAGVITGRLNADFLVDSTGQVCLNDIELGADGYKGRQFEGKWISNATLISKVCNWGDWRVPRIKGSENHIDTGDGEFMVNPSYRKNGWENFCIAWNDVLEGDEARQKQARARKKENNWWK